MADENRWEKLEEIVRRVVREEIAVLGKKGKLDFINGRWVGVTQEQKDAWAAAYGAVDIEQELKKAAAWVVSNPSLAPKSQYGRFFNTWLVKEQNKASIRSIPTRNDPVIEKKKLCAYCEKPATAWPNRTPACEGHFNDAMHHEPIPFMRGMTAKNVTGER